MFGCAVNTITIDCNCFLTIFEKELCLVFICGYFLDATNKGDD